MYVCKFRGHVIVNESSIGPDSGSEHLYCERCGWSDTIVYY